MNPEPFNQNQNDAPIPGLPPTPSPVVPPVASTPQPVEPLQPFQPQPLSQPVPSVAPQQPASPQSTAPQTQPFVPQAPQPVQPQPQFQPQQPFQPQPPQPFTPQQPGYNVAPQPMAGYASPVQPKKGIPKAIKIAAIVISSLMVLAIGFVVIVMTIANINTAKAQEVSLKVVKAVQSNDPKAIYDLSSSGFKKVATEAQLDSLVKQVSPLLQGSESLDAKGVRTDGNNKYSVFVYSIATSGGKRYMKVTEINENNEWLVFNFLTSATQLTVDGSDASNTSDTSSQ